MVTHDKNDFLLQLEDPKLPLEMAKNYLTKKLFNYLFFWVLGGLAPKKYYFSQENAKRGGPKNPILGQKLSQKKLFNYLFFFLLFSFHF